MCYYFAVSDFLARTVVINNVSECSCCEIACCCEYISSLPAGAAEKVQALLITLKAMKGNKGKILPGNVFHVNPMNLDNMLSPGTQQCTWLEDGFVRYPFLCSNPFTLLLPLGKVVISYRKELWSFLEWAGKVVSMQLPMKGSASSRQPFPAGSCWWWSLHGPAVTPFLKGAEMAVLKCKAVFSPLQSEGIRQKPESI